jgi:hypothetical protein
VYVGQRRRHVRAQNRPEGREMRVESRGCGRRTTSVAGRFALSVIFVGQHEPRQGGLLLSWLSCTFLASYSFHLHPPSLRRTSLAGCSGAAIIPFHIQPEPQPRPSQQIGRMTPRNCAVRFRIATPTGAPNERRDGLFCTLRSAADLVSLQRARLSLSTCFE